MRDGERSLRDRMAGRDEPNRVGWDAWMATPSQVAIFFRLVAWGFVAFQVLRILVDKPSPGGIIVGVGIIACEVILWLMRRNQ